MRSTASPRVGPLVLALLSTLVGNVGARLFRCDESACTTSCDHTIEVTTYSYGTETYRATTSATGTGCECNGNLFPIYQQWEGTTYYNKFLWYSCDTKSWGLESTFSASNPTFYGHDLPLNDFNGQCPVTNANTCSGSSSSSSPSSSSSGSTASSPPPPWSSGGALSGDCADGEKEKDEPAGITYFLYGISGLMAVLAVGMVGLYVSSSEPKKSDPTLTGTLSKEEVLKQAGWGPKGFLFPREWIKIWLGYFGMLLVVTVVIPSITPGNPVGSSCGLGSSVKPPSAGPWLEALIAVGPFVQLLLMPVLWSHKHRQVKAKIMGEAVTEEESNPLDPDALTTIFGKKLPCKAKVLGLLIGTVDLVLRMIKRVSFGTINLQAFFFPAPFYDFYTAKLLVNALQVDGRQIAITATQADSYMKFCTEQMLNFWTLGFYGLCCKGRINYNRWLDRHLVWKGGTPKGYNNQFRVFDDKLTCVQNLKMFGLNALGGCLGIFPIIGALWPVAQVAQWYRYKLDLLNMKFGGAQPFFVKEFTACNYTIKYYTIGVCGLCSMPVKKYVDTCIKLGEPTFDKDMAAEDAEADAANPDSAPPATVEMQATNPPSATPTPATAVAERV
jgi:hypothetical protein